MQIKIYVATRMCYKGISDALLDTMRMKERLTTIMDTFLKDVLHPPLYAPDVGPAKAECHRHCMFQKKAQVQMPLPGL